ncbi:MAG: alanine--tRNA ligase [Rickettsiales bacterium]
MKTVSDIRSCFLDFFKRNGHEICPSGSLVPHNDPTLMFANAGMNQFKNVFTGAEKLAFSRATSSQKCVRAGGKHNDLDNVGYTARHHTFFEMLGNFSFGDYFKDDAINLAWDLLTKDFGLSKDKLYITVYHIDDEAFNIWKKVTGFPDSKIIKIATNDNFWSMGDTGPCGPCSEIFYDHGEHIEGGLPGTANEDGDRYIEIWNLVFMQYEQMADGSRVDLPKPSIDTGMGLERISAVVQGVHDNYDIDLFKNIINASKHESQNTNHETSHRVIADHLRSSCFLIADGVLPSNEGRGYVLRRIMRRAMRHAHQLGCKEPLMYKLVPTLISEMGEHYPELKRAEATISENLKAEEERFKQTLERGLKLLDEETEALSKGQKLAGDSAFKLYDTYGFPLDLTQDILRNRGLEVDVDGFDKAMDKQREMARAAWSGSGEKSVGNLWFEIKEKLGATEFLGYEQDSAEAEILAIVKDGIEVQSANSGDKVSIILNHTPFYGESGGQIGDQGVMRNDSGLVIEVGNTVKPISDMHVHQCAIISGNIHVGDKVFAAINSTYRNSIRANHSATHLLHKALRDVLGEHVTQKGSLVHEEGLRFDISHNKPVSRAEIAEVEKRVNKIIWQNTPVSTKVMTPDEAINAGAMALFGEKYGDEVRVLSMGEDNYSVELCGGTHVHATGDIGLFKIVSEGAVAAGIRRIEAVTHDNAFKYLSEQENTLRELAGSLKVAISEVPTRVEQLSAERKKLEKELADAKKQLALGGGSGGMEAKSEQVGNYSFIAKNFDGLDPKELRSVAEGFIKQAQIAVVSTMVEGKVSVVVAVEKETSAKISAVTLVQSAVAELGGKGGGGRPEMAQGGGADVSKLEQAIDKVKSIIN